MFEKLIKLSVNIIHHIDEKMRMIGNIYFSFHSDSLWFELNVFNCHKFEILSNTFIVFKLKRM